MCTIDASSALFAPGSADGAIQVQDLRRGHPLLQTRRDCYASRLYHRSRVTPGVRKTIELENSGFSPRAFRFRIHTPTTHNLSPDHADQNIFTYDPHTERSTSQPRRSYRHWLSLHHPHPIHPLSRPSPIRIPTGDTFLLSEPARIWTSR